MYTEISNFIHTGLLQNQNGFAASPVDYKAALYIRLSKEDDNENESQSVTNQRSILMEYIQKHGLHVYDEYIDDGYSGGNFDRPAFKRLIDDIEAKKVNMVITKDMSRLGRDYIQTGYYTERYFPEKRVRYISLLDGIDTGIDSSMNDITPFKAIMNDMYAKDISKKIKSVKHDKQRKGLFIGGKAPYGYILSPNKKNTLMIDEEAAEIVKMIFNLALRGKSCRETAVTLNEENIPPPAVYANLSISRKGPYSGLWSSERVTHILKNQMYIGNMVQGITKKVNYKSKKSIKMPKEQWIVVENTHPAIIEKSDFDKVQLLINSRRRTRTRTYDYLLKGIIFCKECGYPLGVINRVLSGNIPTLYFICRTYQRFTKLKLCTCHCVRVEEVTNAVVNHVKKLCRQYLDRNEFNEIAKSVIEEIKASNTGETELQKLSDQINNLTLNMDKLYSDKLKGILDDSDFHRLYGKFKNDRSLAQEKLENIKNYLQKNENPDYDIDRLIESFMASMDTNREFLCSFIEKIELSENKEIYIHFRFREPENLQNNYNKSNYTAKA
ncbi:MAG: recombinase family protein [Lachnospiraceae bacterium]|nr:recombinase family protein [Lachnospiraceae bacterium]